MHPSPVLDALGRVPLFSELPEEKLAWISERGEEIRLEPGTRYTLSLHDALPI